MERLHRGARRHPGRACAGSCAATSAGAWAADGPTACRFPAQANPASFRVGNGNRWNVRLTLMAVCPHAAPGGRTAPPLGDSPTHSSASVGPCLRVSASLRANLHQPMSRSGSTPTRTAPEINGLKFTADGRTKGRVLQAVRGVPECPWLSLCAPPVPSAIVQEDLVLSPGIRAFQIGRFHRISERC